MKTKIIWNDGNEEDYPDIMPSPNIDDDYTLDLISRDGTIMANKITLDDITQIIWYPNNE